MKNIKLRNISLVFSVRGVFTQCCLLLLCFSGVVQAQHQSKQLNSIVINGETSGVLASAAGGKLGNGRISGHLQFNEESLKQGLVLVDALNVVSFGVDQASITGRKPEGKATSALGFVVDANKPQTLKYNAEKATLSGELAGQLSMDQFYELTSGADKGKGHDLDMRTLPATVTVIIQLDRALLPPKQGKQGEESEGVERRKVKTRLTISAKPFGPLKMEKPVKIEIASVILLELDWWRVLETARNLCIQPVRIGSYSIKWNWSWFPGIGTPTFVLGYSGDGLAFGSPGANKEWGKADITFSVRDWMTIYDSTYSTLTDAEMAALRAEVNEDDCIEVFFVNRFDPQDNDGGGNTVSGGTESSKVISSDENADFGVDLTHLAHEYGHVLTLKHPGQGFPTPALPHRVDGTTGTLMCGSGFNNDNPKINSEDNKDNVANPLLKFSLKVRGPLPDCSDNADCGAC